MIDTSALELDRPATSGSLSGSTPSVADLSRRRFLGSAVLAGGGLVAATVAACAPGASTPEWTCHILPHAEGQDGMSGMVTALVVQEPSAKAAAAPVRSAAAAAGSTAWMCLVG